ncbi:amyloid-beta A4 precursor protein-binding family B member 3 isoform X1 [Nerophis ophidion]|uniref:amyloid-beta A4 precursor protein-binding family B member 3 isoform X1 n=1 Tax=Nerophis ophidion TaxID=159077 RepID=UPI002AE04282|nr:amyloid-beta A4 precursor protein-binding family B member 3 isoform X1 [Nerophis ophidion]
MSVPSFPVLSAHLDAHECPSVFFRALPGLAPGGRGRPVPGPEQSGGQRRHPAAVSLRRRRATRPAGVLGGGSRHDAGSEERHPDSRGCFRPRPLVLSAHYQHSCLGGGQQQWQCVLPFRDFAFVAGDKDSCVLKCHVFRCDAPAKAVAMALHKMCSKMMSGQKATRSLTMESIVPEDLPGQVDYLEAVRQQVQKFDVRYVGSLPVSRAMGMEVLNTAIESIMNATERDQWEASVIHVTDNILSVFKVRSYHFVTTSLSFILIATVPSSQEGEEPFWECQVRLLSFLGVGQDSHTFAVIADGGTQRFECHVFWCEPDAGLLSEAVQAACMVHYQKCLVAQTPPPRTKLWHATPPKIRRANSMDGVAFPPRGRRLHDMEGGGVRRSMMAFFDTFRNKRAAMS